MELPLSGVKVLDLSRVLAGPLAAMTLGDLGAQVIKIEHPVRGDDTRDWGVPIAPGDTTYFYGFNRNKQSLACDLATSAGQERVLKLVDQADVVIENFKAGGMDSFGLSAAALRERNPTLIHCAISGYDRLGDEGARPGYDLLVQGEAGLMSFNGEAEGPPLKFGIAVVDLMTGMYAAQAILAALYQRQVTGKGKRIDVSLYDSGIALTSYVGIEALVRGHDSPRYGNSHPAIVPYGVFEAADGPLVIAVGNNRQFAALCSVLGQPEMGLDERFATNMARSEHREILQPILKTLIRQQTRGAFQAALTDAGIPAGEVLTLTEALASERSMESGMINWVPHSAAGQVPVLSPPWRLDGERLPVKRPPMLNEHPEAAWT